VNVRNIVSPPCFNEHVNLWVPFVQYHHYHCFFISNKWLSIIWALPFKKCLDSPKPVWQKLERSKDN
jgi:hypothetical protein